MNEIMKISEKEQIPVAQIGEISEIIEISNKWRKLFCFTVVLHNSRIFNIAREYENGNRELKEMEINALHKGLIIAFQKIDRNDKSNN